jgi:hypothetical protein
MNEVFSATSAVFCKIWFEVLPAKWRENRIGENYRELAVSICIVTANKRSCAPAALNR